MIQNKLTHAAQKLVEKLEQISEHDGWIRVFILAEMHDQEYDGPTWEKELEDLKRELGKVK